MSYQEALEAAGAEIHQFEQFGSYQGEWYALVTFGDRKGWISGSYGSCSGCDAFESEFGWTEGACNEHRWDSQARSACDECKAEKAKYRERLADFGRSYLDDMLSQEEAEKQASRYIEWDSEAPTMLEFLKCHAVQIQGEPPKRVPKMGRSEYDANAGLKEDRRVNPGPTKVPVHVMTPGWQWFLIGTAAILALAFLSEVAIWLFHMLRPLFGSITG